MTTVAYLTGEYPRATDTFIQREIVAVEACGVAVERFAVRRPGSEHQVGPQQERERERTTYLLERAKGDLVRSLMTAWRRSPARFARSARLAVGTRRLGAKGAFLQVAYFVEAAVLAEEMLARGVDHLHNHFADSSCTVAMLASELSGIPFSFTLHGPGIFFEPNEWHLGTKLERAAFCSTISNFARSQASLFCDPEVWPRIRIVHCGVDPVLSADVAGPGDGVPGPGVVRADDGPCQLLFVGRLDQVKGVLVLFEAVARMVADGRDVRLSLVGDGPQRADLERRTAELGLGANVTFAGFRSQDEVQEHLAAADVFVLPSFAEGVPVSLMEAMARSTPVVATNVGGVTELVRDGVNGLVVAPGDVDALVAALSRLADDATLRRSMGEEGVRTVRADFDSATEAGRLVGLFEGSTPPAGPPIRPPASAEVHEKH